MCGRLTLRTPKRTLVETFGLAEDDGADLPPRYNVAPTQPVAAVRINAATHARELVVLRWGLVPAWADDLSIGNRLINARAETLAEKPAFRSAFRHRRCLVLADGFFEWAAAGGRKQPYYFRHADGSPFALAGLWERWQGKDGEAIESCAVITTSANELLRRFHERMPVILPARDHDLWLDPAMTDTAALQPLLVPYPADQMTAVPVSTRVNNARVDSPLCVQPVVVEGDATLF